jgi:hypothetical protein
MLTGCKASRSPLIAPQKSEDFYTAFDPDLFNFSEPPEHIFKESTISPYRSLGVGGGGAYSGLSMSPFSNLWFVGTDMGTLFRSINQGATWSAVGHTQTSYSSELKDSVQIGFSSNPQIVFHAPGGVDPIRSVDGGIKWKKIIDFPLRENEKIKYWKGHTYNSKVIFAATNLGLWGSSDSGNHFTPLAISGESRGTFLDYLKTSTNIYHALADGIYLSTDLGKSFKKIYRAKDFKIRNFSAGRDKSKVTFAFIDDNGISACRGLVYSADDLKVFSLEDHYAHCGYVWISHSGTNYFRTNKEAGDHIKMAENDSDTIYITGSTFWIKQYGTKVWSSTNAGKTWELKLHQLNWDINPFSPWPADLIDYSAVALDVGWFDSGYENFEVNLRHSNIVGGTGYFFIHTSLDGGEHWHAPFTKFADSYPIEANKKWKSNGLEVTSVYNLKIHPKSTNLIYAGMADLGGMVSEDNGKSFRISKSLYNSNYDYAFDPRNENVVWAAAGAQHDFPNDWHGFVTEAEGAILYSPNKGKSWRRLTPKNSEFNHQFLTVRYDYKNNIIYGGTQGFGIVRSLDRGINWEFINAGLPNSPKIIPQIEIDPKNGNVYALLSGDAPKFTNQAFTGIYLLDKASDTWKLLRQSLTVPNLELPTDQLWYYPTSFAIDFSENSDRLTMWLVDYENNNNWLMTGIWKSTDGGSNWIRVKQFTHPLSIILDTINPKNIYVTGLWKVDGSWGNGGLMYSTDGGINFKKNLFSPFQANGRSAIIDPSNTNNIFYTFFGSSILYGPRPEKIYKN